jgi:hypothetical protein
MSAQPFDLRSHEVARELALSLAVGHAQRALTKKGAIPIT